MATKTKKAEVSFETTRAEQTFVRKIARRARKLLLAKAEGRS